MSHGVHFSYGTSAVLTSYRNWITEVVRLYVPCCWALSYVSKFGFSLEIPQILTRLPFDSTLDRPELNPGNV